MVDCHLGQSQDSKLTRPGLKKQATTDEIMFNRESPPTKFENEEDPFNARIQIVGNHEDNLHRQRSIISFENLSINGSMSVCDSHFSHYNPSINEPFVSEDADPEEKEMHAFLDLAGIY